MGEIERAEYKHFYPLSTLHLNEPNKKTEFNIDFGDGFCTSKFQFYISGKLTKSDGTNYDNKANIKLINNFVPYLFSKIEVRKHNKLIEEIECPGQLSTIKGTITYSKADSVSQTGFESDFKSKFECIGNLSHFGLGFFENVNIPIYKGGFNITFVRSEDNDAIFRWKTKKTDGSFDDTTLPAEGKITIDEFFIRVPIISYKTTSKIQLINEITKKEKLSFHFNHWQCIEQKNITGKTYSFDITNIYRNIYNPKFIIVGFQKGRLNDQQYDTSIFDHMHVKNIRVKLNGHYYPDELLNLDIDGEKYRIIYQMYQDYKKVYYDSNNMYYNPKEFIDNRTLYVIDTTKTPVNISGSKNDIIINMDFEYDIQLTSKTNCYVVVVSERLLEYNVIKNDILEIK
jgi:hypothetical protein